MSPRVLVFAPAPLLTVTIEQRAEASDIHLHAGSQGVWQARMLASLGADVVLCAHLGGETGTVLRSLIDASGVRVRAVHSETPNGAYVHDRRSGERREVADAPGEPLARHQLDELYNVALVEGLDADICLLSGPTDPRVVPAETYRRLAADLSEAGRRVVVDLSREHLREALAGRVCVAKVSHEQLLDEGRVESDDVDSLLEAARVIRDEGARHVVISRAGEHALALLDGEPYAVTGPALEVADSRGAGDSMTAGISAALARGESMADAVCLGAAAGALNVTRHGLGTGNREAIERLMRRVDLHPLSNGDVPNKTHNDDEVTVEELARRVDT